MKIASGTFTLSRTRPSTLRSSPPATGHHPRVGEHRHEVGVAAPARHDVHMDVVLDPGSGDPPLVEADVVSLRGVGLLEHGHRALGERHHLGERRGVERGQRRDVLERRHHQVPVGVREQVQDHEAVLAAVDDQVRFVVGGGRLAAEDALRLGILGGVLHVGEAPRRPDPLIGHTAAS